MDGIMDDEESEEDTERIVAGVFDELNIQVSARGSDAGPIISHPTISSFALLLRITKNFESSSIGIFQFFKIYVCNN